ncbi:hypothetical protein SLS62_005448 [Diatrype stigma]|uniref:Uncharacterized protein n=1 Tax=Diatrype stigma TaxID=117547 RepID=A0AAN9UP98_9PEZI
MSIRDSGIGSSSSEYASLGSRPDRMFTAHNYDQRQSVGDLQEALERATKNAEYYKNKCQDIDHELKKSHTNYRESEARWKAECGHNEQLEQELSDLKEKHKVLQTNYDVLLDQYTALSEQYTDSMNNSPMMSTALPIRTKSKHESIDKRQKDRMKARIAPKDETIPKSSSHRSTRTHSRAPSTKRDVYIEEAPPRNYKMAGSESHRHSSYSSSVPRTSQPVNPVIYHTSSEFPDGDYHPYPLPAEPRGRR